MERASTLASSSYLTTLRDSALELRNNVICTHIAHILVKLPVGEMIYYFQQLQGIVKYIEECFTQIRVIFEHLSTDEDQI